jgi:hypothetical protein
MKMTRQALLLWGVNEGSAMRFLYMRLGLSKALLIGIIATALVFTTSCQNIGVRDGAANSNTNSANAANTNSASTRPPRDEAKYKELLDKESELAKLTPPLKLDPKAMIKGKVLVVGNLNTKHGRVDDGISSLRKAESLEELETLIQVDCSKGRFLSNYEKGVKGYASVCKVSLIDYRTPAVIAQKTFTNTEREEVIRELDVRDNEYVAPHPVGDIRNYIDSFQVNKVMPMGILLDEKELLKLATTLNLNPSATLKGKIKVVDKYEDGSLYSWLPYNKTSSIEMYGLPSSKFTHTPEELETLVRVICSRGSMIGKVGNLTQYSNKCEVSLIDYKTLTVFANKIVENKNLDKNVSSSGLPGAWVVERPKQEIEDYLKNFPT